MSGRPKLRLDQAGVGPAFVFQHGLCGDAAQAAEVIPAEAPYRRLTLECRGHGLSEPGAPAEFGIATFTDDVIALIEAEGIAPVVLGGISMGAAMALRLAVLRPDLVRALVLARPAWFVEPAPENMRPFGEVGDLLAAHPADLAREEFERSETAALLAREAPDNLASLRSFFSRQPLAVTAALLSRIAADGPGVTSDQVGTLRLPTLVVGHGRDVLHPMSHAESLVALIPGARMVEITPKATDRDRYVVDFRAALQGFLNQLPSR